MYYLHPCNTTHPNYKETKVIFKKFSSQHFKNFAPPNIQYNDWLQPLVSPQDIQWHYAEVRSDRENGQR
jgi:hypothetical protein